MDNPQSLSPMRQLLLRARAAAKQQSQITGAMRLSALAAIADSLTQATTEILAANNEDLAQAGGLSPALRDRLALSPDRVRQMVRAVVEVQAQPDPLGERRAIGSGRSGVQVYRQRLPLGVIAMIYEARPNVTAEAAALAIKSGNAIVLRGGKEAAASNQVISAAVRRGLQAAQLPLDTVQLVQDPSRSSVIELLGASGFVDLLIPRGGEGLMALCDEHARVPMIRHGQGICQVYVDASATTTMAVEIAFNAKVQRPGVCNAMETLLIHASKVEEILTVLAPRLIAAGVALRADQRSHQHLTKLGVAAQHATEEDFATEFLDLILAVRTVDSVDDALAHIATYGTHHTAAIVSGDAQHAERFLNEVDASCVLWNASTRFNDGGELGLGAEMGISTSKMHAYGPMGARELTSEKLVVVGTGQVR